MFRKIIFLRINIAKNFLDLICTICMSQHGHNLIYIPRKSKMSLLFRGHHHQLPLFMDFFTRQSRFLLCASHAQWRGALCQFSLSKCINIHDLVIVVCAGGGKAGPATHATCTLITICQDPRCRARATRCASRRSTSLSERGNY